MSTEDIVIALRVAVEMPAGQVQTDMLSLICVPDNMRALLARIAELEEDSARYRWLREEDSLGRQIDVWSINDAASEASTLYGTDLDAAIDLSRKEKGAQG